MIEGPVMRTVYGDEVNKTFTFKSVVDDFISKFTTVKPIEYSPTDRYELGMVIGLDRELTD